MPCQRTHVALSQLGGLRIHAVFALQLCTTVALHYCLVIANST